MTGIPYAKIDPDTGEPHLPDLRRADRETYDETGEVTSNEL